MTEDATVKNGASDPTLYQILHVHPGAPLDLITGAYWRLTGRAQSLRGAKKKAAEVAQYHLTRAYETLAAYSAREEYDRSLGFSSTPMPTLPQPRRIPFFTTQRSELEAEESLVDYYELLRIDPGADPLVVAEAHIVMRDYYLRIIQNEQYREKVLELLEEAHSVIADPERRRQYDARRAPAASESAPTRRRKVSPKALNGDPAVRVKTVRGGKKAATPAGDAKQSPPLGPTRPVTKKKDAVARQPKQTMLNRVETAPVLVADKSPRGADGFSQNRKRGKTQKAANTALPAGPPAAQARSAVAPASKGVKQAKTQEDPNPVKLAQSLAARSADAVIGASQRVKQALDDRAARLEFGAEQEAALMNRFLAAPVVPPSDVASNGTTVKARLTVVGGPETGRVFEMKGVSFTLGCGGTCDVELPGLAPEQARLVYSNGNYALHSVAEAPVVRIHGECVDWAVLENGDTIEAGPYQLRFESASV